MPSGATAGTVLHVRTYTLHGWAIRRALESWGNHDALLDVEASGEWVVLDMDPPRARVRPYAELLADIAQHRREVRLLRPRAATAQDGRAACDWWRAHILGTPYAWLDFARLTLACISPLFRIVLPRDTRWYCTEAVRDAWRVGAGIDPWHKRYPTPRDTEEAIDSGELCAV